MENKFELGQIVATQGVMEELGRMLMGDIFASAMISKHASGDWGEMPEEDKELNDSALIHGGRLMSSYKGVTDDVVFWVITEADRSYTTILFPSEY